MSMVLLSYRRYVINFIIKCIYITSLYFDMQMYFCLMIQKIVKATQSKFESSLICK